MASEPDVTTTQWLAVIALILALLIPVAIALAWWFKGRYARAIVRLQASAAASTPQPAALPVEPTPDSASSERAPPLAVRLVPAASIQPADGDPTAPARRLRRRVLLVQFTLGLLYWIALLVATTIGLLIYSEVTKDPKMMETSSDSGATLSLLTVMLVPPLLAWSLQAGVRERVVWWIIVAGAVALGIGSAMNGQGWVAAIVTPVLLGVLGLTMTAFLRPAVRGAGPPLVAAMIVAFLVFCVLFAIAAALDNDGSDDWGTWSEIAMGIVALLAILAFSAWIGWRMLIRISRRYLKKRFSELQLALGSYWGLMTLFVLASIMLIAFEEKTGGMMEWVGLLVLLAWLAWRVAQRLVLRLAVRKAAPALSPLLLLRVFKPSNRSEAFMDRFLARWRFAAPVWMIGGPDLAGALMEPDEFFAYLRRNLNERFVRDAGQIGKHLAALDGERDPDGRFRVSELFCANTTWQQAVLAMIERAGVILLDLREYTPNRAGTRYELQELLRRAPLERVLVLTDEGGEAPQLKSVIAEAWQAVGRRSGQTVHIVQLERESDAELDGLFRIAARAEAARLA